MTATLNAEELTALQAAVDQARAEYHQAQDDAAEAMLDAEHAWCALFAARWKLARAQGRDPTASCFQED